VPSRIESLSRIERIAAGPGWKSAAVDVAGRLFTWGAAQFEGRLDIPNGFGYAMDQTTECQPTPKRVDALSQDRVVGVAFGDSFTLAMTDDGTVFSFGCSRYGELGHGSLNRELPRQIEALLQMGQRFVGVAAGERHALALTKEGGLYGWGDRDANSHGRQESTPCRVAARIGQRIKLVDAQAGASCAVTEKSELFT